MLIISFPEIINISGNKNRDVSDFEVCGSWRLLLRCGSRPGHLTLVRSDGNIGVAGTEGQRLAVFGEETEGIRRKHRHG